MVAERVCGGNTGVGEGNKEVEENLKTLIIKDIRSFNSCLEGNDEFCIDMDVVPFSTIVEEIDEREAIARFTRHIASVEQLGETTELLGLVHDRLAAQVAYRNEIAKVRAGEPKTPYDEYLRSINGFGEKDVEEGSLEEEREKLIDCALEVMSFADTSGEGLRSALLSYNDKNSLRRFKDVVNHYWRYAPRFRDKFAQRIGVDLKDISYQIVYKRRDAFWKFYERPMGSSWELWMNWHKRHKNEYNIALVESYTSHEDCHFDVGEIIRQEINSGNLDPFAGLITIPGPDSYYLEGLAMTAHDWVDFGLTNDGRLGTAVYKLEKIALLKGFYLLEHGVSIDEVIKRIARYIPMKTLDQITNLLEEGITDPFARAYQVVYGRAVMDFEGFNNNLSPENKLMFIREVVKTPKTREQILKLYTDIVVA